MENKHFSGMHKYLKRNETRDGFVYRKYVAPEVSVECRIPFADLTKGEKEPTHWDCTFEYDGLTETKLHTFEQLSNYFESKIHMVRNKEAELF